jgi:hypothetical protein
VKLYFSDDECRRAGFSVPMVETLRKIAEFVDTQAQLAAAQADIASQGDAIDDANTDITAANAAINALDVRIDAYDGLAPFVRQDQAARPAYSAYAGQTVSVGYVQAEAQATDNAVKALATSYALLLTRLDTVNLLT